MPLLSLCIPTNGAINWVLQTIESIYSQRVDNDLFEVLVTDNSPESRLGDLLTKYNLPNLRYYKSDREGFLNINFALNQANGVFRKMLNHRSCLLPGALQRIIDLVKKYEDRRPILYFTDNCINSSSEIITCQDYNEFIHKLHLWITWSAGCGIWIDDIPMLDTVNPDKMFPHICMILDVRKNSECVLWNGKYQQMQDDGGKGGYNLFHTFGVDFLNLLLNYHKQGKISESTYLFVKKELRKWMSGLYYNEVIHKSKHTFDLTNIRSSLEVHYQTFGYVKFLMDAYKLYAKEKIRKYIKK